ncbi:MAG: transketolase [Syntrophobacteraceae bacterium]|jgi:transketolase
MLLDSQIDYHKMANALRFLAMDAVDAANSGHPGMPLGVADIATVLFTRFLKFDPDRPDWADRDRFVLSAGHGSMLLYALLYLTGYKDMTLDDIRRFRQLGSRAAGHPEYGLAGGIEMTTGPLGQGIASAVGMALGERIMNARFGNDLVDHYTYALVGDGCLMEGVCQEAISLAGHLGLSKLIVLWDNNSITIDGETMLAVGDDQCKRFEASGWHCQSVDGHDREALTEAISSAQTTSSPSFIACKTTIGFGSPTKAGSSACHGSPLGAKEIEGAREKLNWPYEPFEVPDEMVAAWRRASVQGKRQREAWQKRLEKLPREAAGEFARLMNGELPETWERAFLEYKESLARKEQVRATRNASGEVLEVLTPLLPELVGGSADLTGSVNTRTKDMKAITRNDFSGRYIHYGVREHGMAAIMNGLALHGGIIPYSGTFLVFADYMRGAMRLSALMKQRIIYILTHDSIGLGEDGPTHQPVETLATLRALPNFNVMRPADAVETAECWAVALQSKSRPTGLILTRQNIPPVRTGHVAENLAAKGAYVLREAEGGERALTLIASGSEVHLALQAWTILQTRGVPSAVVSMPCMELFDEQDQSYQTNVLGANCSRIAVEAALSFGWHKYLDRKDLFIGMQGFGASGPADKLFAHFGITVEAVVESALALVEGNR